VAPAVPQWGNQSFFASFFSKKEVLAFLTPPAPGRNLRFMPLPALNLLDPSCPIKPAWARFEAGWYLARHADARALCAGKGALAALNYYLRVGARLGHSPSPLFDEEYYLSRNPDIAELVRAGNYASGFDHFCRHGHRGVSPHWLFDDELYENLYEDMTLENLDQHRCYGRYDHYLKSGQREQRMGQFLFDATFYRNAAIEAGVAAEEIDSLGPYVHCLLRLATGEAELPTSIYFDPAWYLNRHPGAKAEVARGRYTSALQHYLCSAAPEHLDPVPEFSEAFYRRRHPDIATAVESGFYRSGYQQFVQYGAFELRQPAVDIDLVYYRDMNERVRNDLNSGAVRDAFAHLRLVGLPVGLVYAPPEARPAVTEPATRQQFLAKARAHLTLFARQRLDFTTAAPEIAVVMVLFNKFELTMLALASLRDNFAGGIELILVDNDSVDDTRRIADYVRGTKIIRNPSNLGFLRACNLGLGAVTAPAVLYLNNDVELAHGTIVAALARLNSDAAIAAVGGKIIRSNGVLQEAGSIIWNEGTTIGYLRDASPLVPEANFVRDVDYCSAVFLLCKTAVVQEFGGFDEAFSPAYFEEVDLCVRLITAGYRVVYEPLVVVYHLEFGSASTTEASMALMRRGKRIFKKKHQAFLAGQYAPAAKNLVRARARNGRRHVLYIEDTVPLRRLGSGFVRSNDVVHGLADLGFDVHVFPTNGAPYDVMSLYGDLPDSAEILHDREFFGLADFLAERQGFYDLIWIARTHNFTRCWPVLKAAGIDPQKTPVVLDTEAVVTAREAAQAALQGKTFDFAARLKVEFAGTGICTQVLAVNAAEAALLTQAGLPRVAVLGTARAPAPTPAGFGAREGLLFVAAIHQKDSPNLDALHWYVSEIYPELAKLCANPPVLNVVGHTQRDIDLSPFSSHKGLKLHGAASELAPFYNAARLFIAPTRYAAGTPYKLFEAASFGLPCVATPLLAVQLGWREEILTADTPALFAARIKQLYENEALWQQLREGALARLAAENSPAMFTAQLRGILEKE
jgi:GT2 family glycosyltransferase